MPVARLDSHLVQGSERDQQGQRGDEYRPGRATIWPHCITNPPASNMVLEPAWSCSHLILSTLWQMCPAGRNGLGSSRLVTAKKTRMKPVARLGSYLVQGSERDQQGQQGDDY